MKKKTGIWLTVGITVLVIAGIIFGYLFVTEMLSRKRDVKNFEELQSIVSDIESYEAGKTGSETAGAEDFSGNDSFSGVPFMDERWHEGAGISIIYGHHMANGTMFGSLPLYSSQEYRDKHPIIEFDTRFEEREFEVMAVFLTEIYPDEAKDVFKYYDYADLSDKKDFDEFIKGVKALALYDTGVEAEYGDELLVLSTCNYHTEAGRLVVVGKQIK